MTTQGPAAPKVNDENWVLKTIVMLVLTGLFFVIKNGFFGIVMEIGKFLAGAFLIFVIIYWIDLMFKWGSAWIAIYDRQSKPEAGGSQIWLIVIVFTSLLIFGITGYLTGRNFDWFFSNEVDC